MLRNQKGFIYYELIISLLSIIVLITFFLSIETTIILQMKNDRLTYQMKQNFYRNLILFESGEPLIEDASYQIEIYNDTLCIKWMDLNEKTQCYCEMYWL